MSDRDPPEAEPPEQFDEYELVLLWSASDRAELEFQAAERIHPVEYLADDVE